MTQRRRRSHMMMHVSPLTSVPFAPTAKLKLLTEISIENKNSFSLKFICSIPF